MVKPGISVEFSSLPEEIPIFPLTGALLLPGGQLPLNIFEPRYISMVNYALKNDRLIGMIQTREKNTSEFSDVSISVGGGTGDPWSVHYRGTKPLDFKKKYYQL